MHGERNGDRRQHDQHADHERKEGSSYTATAPDGTTMTVNGRCRGYPYGSTATPTNYKPTGLMQKYAAEANTGTLGVTDNIRYSIFGYLKDEGSNTTGNTDSWLDGGVMRARMKSAGLYQANPGATVQSNDTTTNSASLTSAEWLTDGTLVVNPDANDATNTPLVTNGGSTPLPASNGVSQSGVINYLNLFGFPVSSSFTQGATQANLQAWGQRERAVLHGVALFPQPAEPRHAYEHGRRDHERRGDQRRLSRDRVDDGRRSDQVHVLDQLRHRRWRYPHLVRWQFAGLFHDVAARIGCQVRK